MNLEKMLEYQKIDQEIYKLELDLLRSKEMARVNNFKNQIGLAETALLRLNKEANELFYAIESLEKDIAAVSPDKSIADSANTPEKLENAEKTLSSCLESLANIEKEAKKAFDRLSSINRDAAKQSELGRNLSVEHRKAREDVNVLYNKIKVEQKDNFAKLNELSLDIDAKLMSRYKTLREHRRMPAIVTYAGNNCSACGMNISIEVGEKLKNQGDLAECPNCRRVVYLK